MRKTLLIFLMLFVVGGIGGCASLNIDHESQSQRIGVKATTMVLIDKGHITKERLGTAIDLSIDLLGEDSGRDIETLIKEQIGYNELSPPAKLAVDEFLLAIKDNISLKGTLEEQKKQTMIVLGWIKDALSLYD